MTPPVLNAFELAKLRPRAVPGSEKPLTQQKLNEQKRRENERKANPGRIVRVVDAAGRAIPFDRPKGQEIVLEGSVSGQQSTTRRAAMRKARI